jgi:hypothetical protein
VKKTLVGIWVLLLAVCSCNYRVDKFTALQSTEASFDVINQNIIGPRCLSCHNGPASPRAVDLSSYESMMGGKQVVPFKPLESPLFDSISKGRMPKGQGSLPDAEIALVKSWIEQGAKKTGGGTLPPPSKPKPIEPSFDWISTEILSKRCTGCHNGTNKRTDLDLRTYESLMEFEGSFQKAVEPGDPKASGLYLLLDEREMPPSGPPVEGEELEAIKEWIRNGAPKEKT